MAYASTDDGAWEDEAPLKFHPKFAIKRPSSVILQADDNDSQCFYFSLSLLSAISSFFASLPAPSADDLVHGYALIPLHDTTSPDLFVFLSAVQSVNSSDPFTNPLGAETGYGPILHAAIMGRKFDCPAVVRILAGGLGSGADALQAATIPYVVFAIWALGDVRTQLEQAAQATVRSGAAYITDVDAEIADICRSHSGYWYSLLEFHIRYFQAPLKLQTVLKYRTQLLARPFAAHGQPKVLPCVESLKTVPDPWRIYQQLLEARTTAEVLAIRTDHYGLRCETCYMEAEGRFGPHVDQLSRDCKFLAK